MKTFALISLLLTGTAYWAAPDEMRALPARLTATLDAGTSTAPAAYETVAPKLENIAEVVRVTGSLAATKNIEVGSQLSGRIDKLLVDFNQNVTKGQPLAILDTRSYQARVDETKAILAGARASVKVMTTQLDRARIDVLQAETMRAVLVGKLNDANIQYASVSREVERKKTLAAQGASTLADLQDATARRDLASSAVHEAEANLKAQDVAIDGTHSDLARAQTQLDAARTEVTRYKAQFDSALVDLDRCWIRSPIDGVIVGRNVDDGQTLASSLEARTLFNIAGDLHHMQVYARVDETDIGRIKLGQKAQFTVDAFPSRVFPAQVQQIRKAPQVLQNVVTYTVVLSAENPDGALLPGMTALATITISNRPDALTVPMAALQFTPETVHTTPIMKGDEMPLWILRGAATPRMIPVVPGEQQGERIAIRSGDIRPGDRIIVGLDPKEAHTASISTGTGL